MWIESVSTLHAMLWRGELRREQADPMRDRVLTAPVRRREPDGLAQEAWRIADELGWAKTYDANYVALARLLKCQLVTLDARMRRGTARSTDSAASARCSTPDGNRGQTDCAARTAGSRYASGRA
jgi:predicted nucleic acid-binding protein